MTDGQQLLFQLTKGKSYKSPLLVTSYNGITPLNIIRKIISTIYNIVNFNK